jgi:hypothetical protein
MAKEAFYVVFAQQGESLGLDGAVKSFTKAEAEALDPRLKEACVLEGPVSSSSFVKVEAENAAQAAKFVKTQFGAGSVYGSNFITVKASNWTETSPI